MPEGLPPDALDRLEAVTRDLDAYLERRAIEIAAPGIVAAEDAAAVKVRAAEARAQRAEDLVAELRRHVRAYEDRLDDLCVKYGERRDPHVVERRRPRPGDRPQRTV
jgi:hypothetical protein